MNERYFYLSLIPSDGALAFIFTTLIKITYSSEAELKQKQNKIDQDFRKFNNSPKNYNSAWSSGYENLETANSDRLDEITSLKNAGKTVKTPDWPKPFDT
jgi:hypothetical protein